MPFPCILLTPIDASPLNAPVASGATTFGAILATVERAVLAKKRCKCAKKSPLFHFLSVQVLDNRHHFQILVLLHLDNIRYYQHFL